MYAATIDKNALNSLFDNQKKVDDLFDSIFDDENYFISTSSFYESRNVVNSANQRVSSKHNQLAESLFTIKEQHPYFFMFPIMLEVVAIYFVVANFF